MLVWGIEVPFVDLPNSLLWLGVKLLVLVWIIETVVVSVLLLYAVWREPKPAAQAEN